MAAVIVTNHAAKRFKQRVGLAKPAAQRHAQLAYDEGFQHSEARGRLKRYMDKLFLEHRNATAMRVYGHFIYLFAGTTLVTVLPLPKGMQAGVKSNGSSED